MKILFEKTTDELYPNELPHEDVYCIRNERGAFVGLIYLSELLDANIYVDWIEILVVQRGRGYLREICELLGNKLPSFLFQPLPLGEYETVLSSLTQCPQALGLASS